MSELVYLEAAPMLALLQQVGSGRRGSLPHGTSFAIRGLLVKHGLITPPDKDGWGTADLTPQGLALAQDLAANPPVPPLGLTHNQCRALGSLRQQEISDPSARPGVPRERKAASPSEWRDLEARRLIVPGRPPRPGHAGSAALTRFGRSIADELLGVAGGAPTDCAAFTPATCTDVY